MSCVSRAKGRLHSGVQDRTKRILDARKTLESERTRDDGMNDFSDIRQSSWVVSKRAPSQCKKIALPSVPSFASAR